MERNSNSNIEKYILMYVNNSRKKSGLKELIPANGLIYLARRNSSTMAKRGKIWHGDNVFIAHDYMIKRERMSIFEQAIIFFLKIFSFTILGKPKYLGRGGENVAVMPKGRVRGFHGEIKTDKDIAKALHISWMNSQGHRANILTPDFKRLGVGVKRRRIRFFATELFYG